MSGRAEILTVSSRRLHIGGLTHFSLYKTMDCGQCFRFDRIPSDTHRVQFAGVAAGRYIRIAQDKPDEIYIYNSSEEDFENIWRDYFALDEDYGGINRRIANALPDDAGREVMRQAIRLSDGIRILHQEPWETLCSFIVSQNNNIPRIKKIIAVMSEAYGEYIGTFGGVDRFAFPTAKSLENAGAEAIFALHTGFRASYIFDAAQAVASGRLSLDAAAHAGSYDDAAALLETVKGIGPKVAACTLLFGFGRYDAFPIDVWIRRVLERHFPNGIDVTRFGDDAGIAQQYLFYFERYLGGGTDE